eukprot:1317963-Rhodomonas_salina.1
MVSSSSEDFSCPSSPEEGQLAPLLVVAFQPSALHLKYARANCDSSSSCATAHRLASATSHQGFGKRDPAPTGSTRTKRGEHKT